jgi:hypothetical protein
MTKSMCTLLAVAVVAAGSLLFNAAPARAATPKAPAGAHTPKTNETFIVVQIGDDKKIIHASELTTEKKRVADDYKKAMDDYKTAHKTDKNAEKPKKLIVKKLPKTFKTQQDAQDYLDKLDEKASGSGAAGGTADKKAPAGF